VAVSDINLTDAIQRAKQLDPYALEQVYDAFAPQLSRYIHFRLSESALAQDLHAQVFQSFLELSPRRRNMIENIPTWLFDTARKLVDQQLAERNRARGIPGEELSETLNPPDRARQEIAWLNQLVFQALAGLISDHQHLLALRFGVPLPLEEVSRLMREPVSQVKSLQVDALLTLRQRLETER